MQICAIVLWSFAVGLSVLWGMWCSQYIISSVAQSPVYFTEYQAAIAILVALQPAVSTALLLVMLPVSLLLSLSDMSETLSKDLLVILQLQCKFVHIF